MSLLHLSDRAVDLDARRITGPSPARLTELEARVLAHLVERAERPVGREELLVEVWGYRPGVRSRAPDTLIKQLRRKLEPDPSDPVLLLSIYGQGYRWAGPGLVAAAPRRWPARRPGFLGRTKLQDQLRDWLASPGPVLVLVGPPGIGASRLLQESVAEARVVIRWTADWAGRDLRAEVEDRLGGPPEPGEAALVIIDQLDVSALPLVDQHLRPATAAGALRLCLRAPSTPAWPEATILRVPPLEAAPGLELLDLRSAQLGAAGPLGADPIRRALVAAVAALPGDLEAVAQALTTAAPDEVLAELRTDPDGFWRAAGLPARPALAAAWPQLDRDERRFLQAAAAWPAPVRRDHALAATGLRPATLRSLDHRGLVAVWRDPRGHSRLAVPGAVRAALPAVPLERSQAARARLWEVLLARVLEDPSAPADEREDHLPLLLAAAADPALDDDRAVDVVWTVSDLLDRAGTYRQTLRLLRHRQPASPRARHRRDAAVAAACVRLHRLDEAEAAGLRATASDEPLVQVRAWSSVGSARAIRGQPQLALPAFENAASIDIPPSALRLQMTDNLAAARLQLGDLDGGIAALEANVGEARRMGGGARLASILTNLTSAHAAADHTAQALRAGEEALQLHTALADPRLCAFDHANLALVHSRTSAVATARAHVDHAHALAPRFDDPRLQAWIDLVELLVRCAEGRGTEARAALAELLTSGALAHVARGGGELLDAIVGLAEHPSRQTPARAALDQAPDLHGARLLVPSLRAALARTARV